jgi:hypothetical protein
VKTICFIYCHGFNGWVGTTTMETIFVCMYKGTDGLIIYHLFTIYKDAHIYADSPLQGCKI